MHEIEPYFNWRDYYIAAEDKLSPFYKRKYSEFHFTHKIYNYYIQSILPTPKPLETSYLNAA